MFHKIHWETPPLGRAGKVQTFRHENPLKFTGLLHEFCEVLRTTQYIPGQKTGTKKRSLVKLDRTRKLCFLLLKCLSFYNIFANLTTTFVAFP